ncbi:hypothetical protein AAFC00_002447 [Neodothiora populina]|uniref:Uridine/cytidine kinase n=1 Tax=Neodothiora populina TaxID=2781224 RepID=A0ABR3P736_9PEZI
MTNILDDKSEHCVPFIVERFKNHREHYQSVGEDAPPFFIGLNGVQGAGKTTLVSTLCKTLSSEPLHLPLVVLSIDDLYLPHSQQVELAEAHSENPLVQHRGQPSTHDVALGKSLFEALSSRQSDIRIPSYDKSAFNGQGDRVDASEWELVNDSDKTVEIVLFEGWCVGFRALSDKVLEQKWNQAREAAQQPGYQGRLGKLFFDSVKFINDELKEYDAMTDRLDAFIHIDAEDTQYVYDWRLQQEAALRASKGRGMTDEQVVEFVNGYYPAYELYTDVLRNGIYPGEAGKQLRLVVDKARKVKEIHKI